MGEAKLKTKTKRARPSCLDDVPELVTHREVARLFAVTPAGLRKWVDRGEFPAPHSIIACTWYYRADQVAHRLKTGKWPASVKFLGSRR
jgi:hypothetical protein